MKKKWNFINDMMGRSSTDSSIEIKVDSDLCTDTELISDLFNQFFKNIPGKLKDGLPISSVNYNDRILHSPVSFFLTPIRPSEIETAMIEMKNNSKNSTIPVKFLKLIIPHLSSILCEIFNECISIQYFPEIFKAATVIPIHKSKEKS